MMASSYCEFAFWRAIQYRNGRLDDIGELSSDDANEEYGRMNGNDSSDAEQMNNPEYAQHRFHILEVASLSLIVLFFP